MVQIIAGERGRGKTKQLLEKANEMVHNAQGNMVYIDKSSQNMYGLHKSIRLINMAEYEIDSPDAFRGFIYVLLKNYFYSTIIVDFYIKCNSTLCIFQANCTYCHTKLLYFLLLKLH